MKQMNIHSTEFFRGSIQAGLWIGPNWLLWKNFPKDDSIQHHYFQWLYYYNIFLSLSEWNIIEEADSNTTEYNIQDYKLLAIDSFQKVLLRVGTCEEQLLKITIALLFVRIYIEDKDLQRWEDYFYIAVEIARQYLWDGPDMLPDQKDLWGEIIEVYLEYIDPTFQDIFLDKSSIRFTAIVRLVMDQACNARVQERLAKAADITNYIQSNDWYSEILEKIRDISRPFWFRLSILSEESGEELINHDFKFSGERNIQNIGWEPLTVTVFNEPKNFLVTMDYGSSEKRNQPPEHHLRNIIFPILKRLIRKKEENILFMYAFEKLDIMSAKESSIEIPVARNNYRGFISNVVKKYADSSRKEGYENVEEYIDDCTRAIDICRLIMLYYAKNPWVHREKLPQDIDAISWGKINRSVLNMVRDIILLHTETMSGTGFPYSLSKPNILLIWRIFPIIRAYELADRYLANYTIQNWGEGWYFDSGILEIFLSTIEGGDFPKITPSPEIVSPPLSEEDIDFYNQKIDTWCNILDIIKSIGDSHCQFQEAELSSDIDNQGPIYLGAKGLGLDLLELADVRKIIEVTRHCAAESDVPGWPPGKEDECLTPEWEEDALRKWKLIEWILCSFHVAPSRRTFQTVLGMLFSQTGTYPTLPHPAIMIEEALRNPKNQLNSALNKSTDRLTALQKEKLKKFLRILVSSSGESMDVLVGHTSTVKAAIDELEKLYIPWGTSRRWKIRNDQEFIFLFRWTRLVAIDDPNWGLLFPVIKWKNVLKEVNKLAKKVFGAKNPFYEKEDMKEINLIRLHDLFLDRINAEKRKDPAQVDIFVRKLQSNLMTKYFPWILQAEWVIK
jgi:hypothetical protein